MYKGICISYKGGASGDFFCNFINVCFSETRFIENQKKLYITYYNEIMDKSWNSLSFEQKKIIINQNSPNRIPVFNKDTSPFIMNISKNSWKTNNVTKNDIKLNFIGNETSLCPIHDCWYLDSEETQFKYFNLLYKFQENNIKLYHVDIKDAFTALYVFYVNVSSFYDLETENDNWKKILYNKDLYEIQQYIERSLYNNEWLNNQYIDKSLDVEMIDLSYLIRERDFNWLYNIFKKSYPLKCMLSEQNIKIVNDIWDDRFSRMKKIGLFDLFKC